MSSLSGWQILKKRLKLFNCKTKISYLGGGQEKNTRFASYGDSALSGQRKEVFFSGMHDNFLSLCGAVGFEELKKNILDHAPLCECMYTANNPH